MIHYLKIKNFGPAKEEVEINFEAAEDTGQQDLYSVTMPDGRHLLKLAYIYGPNASGKTTMLTAFEFLRKLLLFPEASKLDALDYSPFLFCRDPWQESSALECSFYVGGIRYLYALSFNPGGILDEKLSFYQSAKPAELFYRETDTEKRLSKIRFGSRLKVHPRERDLLESNTLHNNTVLGAYTKTNVDIPELEALNVWFSSFFLGMIGGGSDLSSRTAEKITGDDKVAKWMNAFLNKADRQISKVEVAETKTDAKEWIDYHNAHQYVIHGPAQTSPSFTSWTGSDVNNYASEMLLKLGNSRKISFIHETDDGSNYRLPIALESSGTQRYFALGGPLYDLVHGNHLLLIDELETSLHPDLMKHFLQTFLANAGDAQLLITTHNVLLLEENDFIRRDALWFTEKGDDGAVSLYSASDFDSITLRKDASLIKAYRSGRLGAKPNLGSPFIIAD